MAVKPKSLLTHRWPCPQCISASFCQTASWPPAARPPVTASGDSPPWRLAWSAPGPLTSPDADPGVCSHHSQLSWVAVSVKINHLQQLKIRSKKGGNVACSFFSWPGRKKTVKLLWWYFCWRVQSCYFNVTAPKLIKFPPDSSAPRTEAWQ